MIFFLGFRDIGFRVTEFKGLGVFYLALVTVVLRL